MEMKLLHIVDRCCLVNKDVLDGARSLAGGADGDVGYFSESCLIG